MLPAASLPTSKMIFSNVVCVRTRNSIQHLMVSLAPQMQALDELPYLHNIQYWYDAVTMHGLWSCRLGLAMPAATFSTPLTFDWHT
jgi:hypothetical protein